MQITCPHCGKTIKASVKKAGQYRTKCKACNKGFALIVSDKPDVAPVVRKLKPKSKGSSAKPKPDSAVETVPPKAEQPRPKPTSSATAGFDETVIQPAEQAAAAASPTEPPSPAKTKSPKKQASANKKSQSSTGKSRSKKSEPIPEKLGGYKITGRLGQGAMGAVYRAQQISLDREVALKTILGTLTHDPRMIARFTREAYAAAQIAHHNVVQIYDLGVDAETHFFAMEFVKGQPLSDLVKESGRLDPEIAVSYILQAARGLQVAHGHGMVHRDVKPANLLISDDGIVKVADLGLVKIASLDDIALDSAELGSLEAARADITMANVAMGTAAFMAPEQSQNAAAVDHRADIYALGCTLYALITGQMPFEGTTALEVISKHRTEPIRRPDAVVKNVPAGLADIVMKMVAKDPGDRYDNMGQVVEELEKFLGVGGVGSFSPSEEHADTMVENVKAFNKAPAARVRSIVGYGFPILCGVIGFFGMFANPWFGLITITIGLVATLAYFVISGLGDQTELFSAVREVVARSSWKDWLTWLGGLLVAIAIAWATGMLIWSLIPIAVGIGLGFLFRTIFDASVTKERENSVTAVEGMLRQMRLRGLEESELRHFVAKYSGDDWEEFYESLFGYRAKLDARRDMERGELGKKRKRFRAWRDPIFNLLDSRLQEVQDKDEEEHLQRVEQQQLEAQGVSSGDAMEQAKQIAAQMVRQAMETRTLAVEQKLSAIDPKIAAEQKRQRVKQMLAEARSSKPEKKTPLEKVSSIVGPIFGSRMRFVVGCLLVTGCLLWIKQNNLFSAEALKQVADQAIESGEVSELEGISGALNTSAETKTEPLRIPVVGSLFDSYLPGIAGLILVLSAFVSGSRMSLFALPAAVITLFGPSFGIPGIAAIGGEATTSAAIGIALLVAGFFLVKPEH